MTPHVTPDGWTTASNSQGNCLQAKRAVWRRMVLLRETSYMNGLPIYVAQERWARLLADVKDGVYTPTTTEDGRIVLDLNYFGGHRPLKTTPENWAVFVKGVKDGLFDAV